MLALLLFSVDTMVSRSTGIAVAGLPLFCIGMRSASSCVRSIRSPTAGSSGVAKI